jgi:hypothetical protein
MTKLLKPIALALVLATGATGCYGRGGALLGVAAFSAIATAAIVTSHPPPPPRVVVVEPPPQRGYVWQGGYWTVVDGQWEWIEGRWIRNHPGYYWRPAHWVEDRDGNWRLIPGNWLVEGQPPPPPPY